MTSKKLYIAIANRINDIYEETDLGIQNSQIVVQWIAKDLAVIFKQDNPRFDRARFLKACGIEE